MVLALTGTPIVNRPLELLPLLDALGVLHLFGGATAFKNRWCGPKKISIGAGRTTTQYTGASNLLELNNRLVLSGHYIRRTKEHLVDKGVMQRKIVDGAYAYDRTATPMPWRIHMKPAEAAEYREAEGETKTFLQDRAKEIAHELGASWTSDRVRRKMAGESNKHLAKITELRQVAGLLKVPYILGVVDAAIDRGEKVVIAAHHKDVVSAYSDHYTGLRIRGEMGVKAIEEAKRLFNETPVDEHPVLVLSIEAGKTGHTLCKQTLHGVGKACALMMLAEQMWTPGDEAQVQDRIWRIGQDREVTITNALLAGTIDEQIYDQRAKKKRTIDAAIDAIPTDLGEKDGVVHIANLLIYGNGSLIGR